MKKLIVLTLVSLFILTGCGSQKPTLSTNDQIRIAVESTIAAIPTYTPYPFPTFPPAPTPISLAGIYCEYQFCIGHPNDMAFFDVIAKQNPSSAAASNLGNGILAANTNNLFIQVVWQNAPGATDPQFMIDLILQSGGDTRNGSVEQLSVGKINVFYVPITPTASAASTLPYGGAAAWTCGGRAFAWKAYTTQPDLAKTLLQAALQRFSCM